MPRGGKRVGAGRPTGTTKGQGMPTKVVRVSAEITKEQLDNLPTLIDALNHWEDRLVLDSNNPRYYYLKQALEEIRAMGY